MISKLSLLSLGLWLLLIAFLNAHLIQAYPQHHYGGEAWGYVQPQRPHMYHFQHHSHRHHHGHGGHRGYGHGYNEFNNQYPDQGMGPNYSSGSYGGGHSRGGSGYGDPRTGLAFGPNNGRQQPEAGYGSQQSVSGYGRQGGFVGQPGTGFGIPPRTGYGAQTFQSRPQDGQDTLEFNHQQSGNAGSSEHNFRQPHDGRTSSTFQPRPQTSGQDTSEFNHQQSGNAGTSGQSRLGGDINVEHNFRQPHDGRTSSTFQPRPQTSVQDTLEFNQQQSGNAGNVWQPRPVVGSKDSGEFQQPRPTGFQTTNDDEAGNVKTIQPLPKQEQTSGGLDQQVGNTFQPRPASDLHSAVEDNIASIFNTNNFMSPKLDDQGSRNPKAEVQPQSVDGRNLFETLPQCPEGSAVHNGRCRKNA